MSEETGVGPNEEPVVRAQELSRIYHVGSREVRALQNVDLSLSQGGVVALRGRSGSGKTTLLNCIGGLDRPTSGHVWFQGRNVAAMSEGERVRLRRHQIGFVFQSHALLSIYSAWENVDLVLRLAGLGRRERRERTGEALSLVGLSKFANHRPFELSGGQQQRVTIARAIATRPALILADEPTGELDTVTGGQIFQLFRQLSDREGTTIIIATHDLSIESFADEVYHLEDGRIVLGENVKRGA